MTCNKMFFKLLDPFFTATIVNKINSFNTPILRCLCVPNLAGGCSVTSRRNLGISVSAGDLGGSQSRVLVGAKGGTESP